MISITILGSGNVAQNLFQAFFNAKNVKVVQVVGRQLDRLDFFKGKTNLATYDQELKPADIYLLAVSDDVITQVSHTIKIDGLVVHTSGSVPLDNLKNHNRRGVFYPLQTFSAGQQLDFHNIPLCVEANTVKDATLLLQLGSILSDKVIEVNSDKRKALHLAAVFVNNFTNYMYTIGESLCTENDLEFSLLKPLIRETSKKIEFLSPYEAQTGPARRGDQKTLHAQLALLKNKNHREIYTLLSNNIKMMYPGKKDKP